MGAASECSSVSSFDPPIREIIVFQPETFPLHRWDNDASPVPPKKKKATLRNTSKKDARTAGLKAWRDKSLKQLRANEDTKDELPELPFRELSCEFNACDVKDDKPGMPCRQQSCELSLSSSEGEEEDLEGKAPVKDNLPGPPRRQKSRDDCADEANNYCAKPPGIPQRQKSCDDNDDESSEEEEKEQAAKAPPRRPRRVKSVEMENPPPFLHPTVMGPSRRKCPGRSQGFRQQSSSGSNKPLDLNEIPLVPISFEGKKLDASRIAQPLQEVVMNHRCSSTTNATTKDAVSVVFAIRRPGCGMCREHGVQLAKLCETNPNVNLVGVIKETIGIHKSIYEFYSKYFAFPLYMDEGWDLFHTIGHKKLNLFQYLTTSMALKVHYMKTRIRNIPFGGDPLTQGGVLVFDKEGKLRFVYYETYGQSLDMEAIQWAIDQANKPE